MAELGPGLLTPAQCPHHTLPTSDVGETSLVWPLLVSLSSLSPDLPKITRSGTGPTPGVPGNGNRLAAKCPCLGFRKGPLCGPSACPSTSRPAIRCSSIFSLRSRDPALQSSRCPGSDLTPIPVSPGQRESLVLQEQPSRK